MTVKQAIAIVIYSLMCIGLSLVIVKCSDRESQRDIQNAQAEAWALPVTTQHRMPLSVSIHAGQMRLFCGQHPPSWRH